MNGAGTGTEAYQATPQGQARRRDLVAVNVAVLGAIKPRKKRLPSGLATASRA